MAVSSSSEEIMLPTDISAYGDVGGAGGETCRQAATVGVGRGGEGTADCSGVAMGGWFPHLATPSTAAEISTTAAKRADITQYSSGSYALRACPKNVTDTSLCVGINA